MSDKIQEIIDKEEEILRRAVAMALAEVSKKPTADNIRNHYAAKKAYDDFLRKKQTAENPEQSRLKPLEALAYLKEQGWKIEKTKLYEDKNIIGYKVISGSITFKKTDLDKYAQKFLLPLAAVENSGTASEKVKWEAKIAEQKFKDMEFNAKIKAGLYVLRSDVEQMLAARAAFLKDNLGQSFIYSRAAKLVEIVQGNSEFIPDLIDYWMKQIEEVFDYYSKPIRFEVPTALIEEEEMEG